MNGAALSKWYAGHSLVRRLWAFRDSQRTRIIVTLEPTHDGDDIYPAWLASGDRWTSELQLLMDEPVQLEAMDEAFVGELSTSVDGVLVAELCWRDSSVLGEDPPDIALATIGGRY